MSYTVVPTVATGDVWTASNHNLYIRDNFRATIPDVITAKGDLIIGDGANTLALLPVGADGTFLAGDLSWITIHDLLQYVDTAGGETKNLAEGGSGNIHVPTDFGVSEGANWIYCMIEMQTTISTAYFALHPSYDTTIYDMIVNQATPSTAPNWTQTQGFMPLDSTGGLFYSMSDTADGANLRVYAWMY